MQQEIKNIAVFASTIEDKIELKLSAAAVEIKDDINEISTELIDLNNKLKSNITSMNASLLSEAHVKLDEVKQEINNGIDNKTSDANQDALTKMDAINNGMRIFSNTKRQLEATQIQLEHDLSASSSSKNLHTPHDKKHARFDNRKLS